MANYGVQEIKDIREKTGAGMLDVKKALDEANGNLEEAIKIIRLKGLKGIAKREGRSASDGLVDAKILENNSAGYILELNSETDFVGKSPIFIELAKTCLEKAVKENLDNATDLLKAKADNGKTIEEEVTQVSATVGEKIVLRRVAKVSGEYVTKYMHQTNKDLPPQVGVVVGINGASSEEVAKEVGHEVAMHIAAYSPTYITRESVPSDIVEKEREIAEQLAKNEGKPEAAIAKIVEGRLTGFYKENVLLDQAFAKDPKKTVQQILQGTSISGFARFRVGA